MENLPKHLQIIEAEKQNKTSKINLGNCGLNDWPEELFEQTIW